VGKDKSKISVLKVLKTNHFKIDRYMKKIFLLLYISFTLCGNAQDYIVTWNNDTLKTRLPTDPAREKLKPAYKFKNGYLYLPAVLNKDSLRVYEAGQIKAYYREKHGKYLLCGGHFESVRTAIGDKQQTTAEGKPATRWYFMAPVLKGKYASLYKVLVWGKRLTEYYYVIKHIAENEPFGVFAMNRKQYLQLLEVPGATEEMRRFIKTNKQFTKMVAEYNRLMEAVQIKK
jgi:hypothetical protein